MKGTLDLDTLPCNTFMFYISIINLVQIRRTILILHSINLAFIIQNFPVITNYIYPQPYHDCEGGGWFSPPPPVFFFFITKNALHYWMLKLLCFIFISLLSIIVYLSIYLLAIIVYLSIYLLSMILYLSIYLLSISIYFSIYLSVIYNYVSVHLSVIYDFVSVYLSVISIYQFNSVLYPAWTPTYVFPEWTQP